MTLDAAAARDCVTAEYADVVASVGACADDATQSWERDSTGDGSALAADFRSRLEDSGTLAALPDVLAAAVDAAGGTLAAEPVAAPPYVAVTSRGPVLRATVEGKRLVVELRAFRLTDGNRYERRDDVAVEASVR